MPVVGMEMQFGQQIGEGDGQEVVLGDHELATGKRQLGAEGGLVGDGKAGVVGQDNRLGGFKVVSKFGEGMDVSL